MLVKGDDWMVWLKQMFDNGTSNRLRSRKDKVQKKNEGEEKGMQNGQALGVKEEEEQRKADDKGRK